MIGRKETGDRKERNRSEGKVGEGEERNGREGEKNGRKEKLEGNNGEMEEKTEGGRAGQREEKWS